MKLKTNILARFKQWILSIVMRFFYSQKIYVMWNRKRKWITIEFSWFGEVYRHKITWSNKLKYTREWLPF